MKLVLPPRHVQAWYCYSFAAEVFSACAMAIFLPITLEHMARDVGYLAPDFVRPCSMAKTGVDGDTGMICRTKILGVWIDTASFSMYVKSVAVALQALWIISIGPLADSAYWRKRLLGSFAAIGSLSGLLFLAIPTTQASIVPLFAAILTIVGNVSYAVATVCSNSFLPSLAKEDEAVRAAWKELHITETGEDQEAPDGLDNMESSMVIPSPLEPIISAISTADLAELPPSTPSPQARYDSLLSLTTSRISSIGTAIGFASGVTVLALLLIPVTSSEGSTWGLQVAIAISGAWWGVFLCPAWIGLPGGKQERGENGIGNGWVKQGWKRVGNMVRPKEMRAIPNLYMFLLAWIFLSDGFHTTTYVAILYASSTLRLSATKVGLIGILVQLSAVFSSLLAPRLQHHLGWSNLRLLLGIVLLAEALPVYACLGLILPWGGLRSEGEMYAAGIWFGMLYGPFNSYSRAVYAELIPPVSILFPSLQQWLELIKLSHESSFFSLFALTDKSASFLGPLVVGLIADLTGNIRLGFVFLLVLLAVPVPVLLRVRTDDGRMQARVWSQRMHGEETEGLLQR